jgi:hypothetical protein
MVADQIDRLIRAEADFRADVIFALHGEMQRLRQHRTIVDQEGGSQASLLHIVGVLEEIAEKLAEQNGQMSRALGRDHPQPELAPHWSLSA